MLRKRDWLLVASGDPSAGYSAPSPPAENRAGAGSDDSFQKRLPEQKPLNYSAPRREFSRAARREIWDRAEGHCEVCGIPVENGCFHYDHIDPDFFSKNNEALNGQLLCTPCHKDKTADDQANIARVKRIVDKRSKALQSKHVMPGSKRSRYRKRMNGRVELR